MQASHETAATSRAPASRKWPTRSVDEEERMRRAMLGARRPMERLVGMIFWGRCCCCCSLLSRSSVPDAAAGAA